MDPEAKSIYASPWAELSQRHRELWHARRGPRTNYVIGLEREVRALELLCQCRARAVSDG